MLPGSILQQLSVAHRASSSPSGSHSQLPDPALSQSQQRPLNFGVYFKNTLVALCHALEDAILQADYQPLVIAAFQRGKWYLEEAERYADLAERSQQVVIMASPDAGFAEHPTSQKPNVALVQLDAADSVAQEWHLIILSPDYTAMVLCQELSEADYGAAGFPKADLERKFYGLWTFEPGLVLETAELAVEHVGRYDKALAQRLQAQVQQITQQIQSGERLCGAPTSDHLGEIVSLIVDYLQQREDEPAAYPVVAHLEGNLLSNELQAFLRVAQLLDQADLSNPMAAAEVASLSEAMGQLLDLPAWQLHRLRLAGLLHRMAFLRSQEPLLNAGRSVQTHAEQPNLAPACPLMPGIQVLRRMQRLRAIATILAHQSEWWDGSGQPASLTGDEIPVESRILALVEVFQQQLAQLRHTALTPEAALSAALEHCSAQAGNRWDPKLIEVLKLLVNALQQGVDLPVTLPKIAAGLWLLDEQSDLAAAVELAERQS
ncbi:MAG: metal-dependent phosphohydrolase [Pegethrix bostrychoides GSE-TBD4-15B]|jgi:DICT domain-containing protein|uniref:Metal-dependent phosphohydrolase n=1 Tax=Pegethrix bostrychoides GSE-TBD4-15B TaxID=2839662 RepID=A0A951P937_9CYAN|nr:metal-dependent phosphohydrolase [Pegethrix bostrychoides GSE-TBD4-15B]